MSIIKVTIAGLVVALTAAAIVFTARPEVIQVPTLGAVASPDIPSPYLNWGDVRVFNAGTSLTQAASTTCAIQNPTGATSTLIAAGVNFDTASSSALIVEMGKGWKQATTTLIGTKYTTVAGEGATIIASTSPTAGNATVFGPNEWFNVKISGVGGPSAATAPVGRCNTTWVAYPTL